MVIHRVGTFAGMFACLVLLIGSAILSISMRKKILLVAGTVVALCIIGAGIYAVTALLANNGADGGSSKPDQAKITPVTVCNDDVIKRASTAIGNNNLSALTAMSTEVMAIGQYKNDANCEYIMARYFLASGQADKASDTINQLQRVLSAGGAYSTVFNPPAINISDLRGSLATLKAQQKTDTQQLSGDDLNEADGQK